MSKNFVLTYAMQVDGATAIITTLSHVVEKTTDLKINTENLTKAQKKKTLKNCMIIFKNKP